MTEKNLLKNEEAAVFELRKLYSDRISSRLTGEFQVIPFYGTDVRKQKLQTK